MEHIVFLDRSTIRAPLSIPSFAHTWTDYPLTKPEQVLDRASNATIIVTNKVMLPREFISALPRLRMVAIPATGIDHVDLDACNKLGIHVANCKYYSVSSVPEHAISLAMLLRRNILAYQRDLRAGDWQRSENFFLSSHPVSDLDGAILGIIGKGTLGRATANIGAAFGMQVLFSDRKSSRIPRDGYVLFDDVLRRSDIISIHCPLTSETRNLIGSHELGLMKSNAVLINTARGGLIDETALCNALVSNRIAGAGLDVLSEEPPRYGNPLLDLDIPNLIITPHIAWLSDSSMRNLSRELIHILETFVLHCAFG